MVLVCEPGERPLGHPALRAMFEARKPAGDNRVGAIVPAYDAAVREVLGKLVTWTNDQAKPAAS